MAFIRKLFVTIIILGLFGTAQAAISFPGRMLMFRGEEHRISLVKPFSINSREIPLRRAPGRLPAIGESALLRPSDTGNFNIRYSLFGLIPVKTATVSVIDRETVVPGGFAVGIRMHTDGLLVVALSDIPTEGGGSTCPGREAGIRPGDIIVSLNGENIKNTEHFARLVQHLGSREAKIVTERDGVRHTSRIVPAFYGLSGEYKTGLWVRDGTMGIGTLSFYSPERGLWGALGHAISDADTGTVLKVSNGRITPCTVIEVAKGKKGAPGEIRGRFDNEDNPLGTILINGNEGIYGRLISSNGLGGKAVPVALRSQVETGPATILANVEGDSVREYSIEIQRVALQERRGSRGMIIKVTDPQLLSLTGGIVQGMSGSPILQNGRFVGAVTHVFVNDPARGYGIFAEWMLEALLDLG